MVFSASRSDASRGTGVISIVRGPGIKVSELFLRGTIGKRLWQRSYAGWYFLLASSERASLPWASRNGYYRLRVWESGILMEDEELRMFDISWMPELVI